MERLLGPSEDNSEEEEEEEEEDEGLSLTNEVNKVGVSIICINYDCLK